MGATTSKIKTYFLNYTNSNDEFDRPFREVFESQRKLSFFSFHSTKMNKKYTLFFKNDLNVSNKNIKHLLDAKIYILHLDKKKDNSLDIFPDRKKNLTKMRNESYIQNYISKIPVLPPKRNKIFIPSALRINHNNSDQESSFFNYKKHNKLQYYSSHTTKNDARKHVRRVQNNDFEMDDLTNESSRMKIENPDSETEDEYVRSPRTRIPTYVEAKINKKRISYHQNRPAEVKEASKNVFIQAKLKPKREIKNDHSAFYAK